VPARSLNRRPPAILTIVIGKNQRQKIISPQCHKKSCSANNRSRRVWIAGCSFATMLPWREPGLHAILCNPENRLLAQRSHCKVRAGNICTVPPQAYRGDNSRPPLFSAQLYNQPSLAGTVIEIQVDDLLPRAQGQLPVDERDGE
jgi:hypothetical protein